MSVTWKGKFHPEYVKAVSKNVKKAFENRPSRIGVCVLLQRIKEDETKKRAKTYQL